MNTPSCTNCVKQDTCKASRTMIKYEGDVSEVCVHYVEDYSHTLKPQQEFVKLKNVNTDIDARMFTLKRKESFEYPICSRSALPKLNGIDLDGLYYGEDRYTFSPVGSFDYDNIRILQYCIGHNLLELNTSALDKIFAQHILNNSLCTVTSVSFRTDTSGLSGPDDAISLRGLSGTTNTYKYNSLYPYSDEISNKPFWNTLIQEFHKTELLTEQLFDVKYVACRDNFLKPKKDIDLVTFDKMCLRYLSELSNVSERELSTYVTVGQELKDNIFGLEVMSKHGQNLWRFIYNPKKYSIDIRKSQDELDYPTITGNRITWLYAKTLTQA